MPQGSFQNKKKFIIFKPLFFIRIILCVDLSIWFIRLFHVLMIFEALGPKLVMIRKMLMDLFFFITIIVVCICAFGITTHAAMYPSNKYLVKTLKQIFHNAYWAIYGDLSVLDEINKKCEKDEEDCVEPQSAGSVYSYIFLVFYLIVANVLLVNLLVALFR